ncbi:hypothetical protein WN55_00889 [Dufourea novaeangliae]|uniref:Uncharacterized protein n=1 Tax=Dufourea novaeangliae TaxID=178035 RepID=A0A154PD47_DUFNO|nr:hypothetical protein WN55_00889 [Dufourea novaeangliae]
MTRKEERRKREAPLTRDDVDVAVVATSRVVPPRFRAAYTLWKLGRQLQYGRTTASAYVFSHLPDDYTPPPPYSSEIRSTPAE